MNPETNTPDQSMQILSLVHSGVGLLSDCVCLGVGVPISIAALIIAWRERIAIRDGRRPTSLDSLTHTAFVLGWVASVISVLIVLVVIVAIGLVMLPFFGEIR